MEHSDTPRSDALPLRESADGRRSGAMVPETLLKSVTGELISRLAQSPEFRQRPAQPLKIRPSTEEIDAFCDALISPDPRSSREAFEALVDRGTTPDSLCLKYFAPAARHLGERWVADTCAFLEVTLGCARLHGLQRLLNRDFTPLASESVHRPTALFSAIPGESHVFGVTMAADFFRRAGWNVDLHTTPQLETLCAQASLGHYQVIGLSIGCGAALGNAPPTVQRLRELQPDAKIVVGGEMTVRDESLAERIGADAVANDVINAPIALKRAVLEPINH